VAWGQAPSYSAAGIVNASNYTAGPFAPNSVLAVFGTNLAYTTESLSSDTIAGGKLPTALASAAVLVDNSPAPLLYVSPTQINFLIPSDQIPGNVTVQVVRQSVQGPSIAITLVDAAPAIFPSFTDGSGYILAEDWNANNAIVTAAAPAHAGDMVILYATGLGHTAPNPEPGEIPQTAAPIAATDLVVLLNGTALDPSLVKYAGLTPGCPGLYQVNLLLPQKNVGTDPEIQLVMGSQATPAGVKLAVQ
jgi:uncharacterized protein (TIGR03437 family)